MTTNHNQIPITYLRPAKGLATLNLKDLWDYRELIYFLTWRDLKVRYKQTVLGFSWVILQPVINMVVFTVLFGQLLKVPTDEFLIPSFHLLLFFPGCILQGH
jgi:lipopolysaccharide transport system permease protein